MYLILDKIDNNISMFFNGYVYLCNVHYPELYDPNKTGIADKLDNIQSNHSLMNYSSI